MARRTRIPLSGLASYHFRIDPTSPLLRRTSIATAVAAACTPAAVGSQGVDWGRNLEVFVNPGDDRVLYGLGVLQPFFGDAVSFWYADLRGTFSTDTEEANIGLGYRRRFGADWFWGAYVAYDYRNTSTDHGYSQIGAGAELVSTQWDLRVNGYWPLNDLNRLGPAPTGAQFVGTRLFRSMVVEEALSGVDGEVGMLLPVPFGETRIFVGGHHFEGDFLTDDADGAHVRLEFRPRKDIILGVRAETDSLYGGETFFTIRYSFGYKREGGVRTIDERMIQFAERDVDVRETSPINPNRRSSLDPDVRFDATPPGGIAHVDNTAGAGGDGSIERPYNSFTACLSARCTEAGMIYVHAGDGTTTGYDQPFMLRNNQQLIGQGYNLFGIGGDLFPTMTTVGSGTDAITLARNNLVAGLKIMGSDVGGIYGLNPGNFAIRRVRMQDLANGHGISIRTLANATYGDQTTTGSIFDVDIRNPRRDGIRLSNYATDGRSATQTIDIAQVSIERGAYSTFGSGIRIENREETDAYDGMNGPTTATQTVTMNDITVTNGGYGYGLAILNEAQTEGGGATANQTVSLVDGSFTGGGYGAFGSGIYIENEAYASEGGTATATQTVTLENVTVSNFGGTGVDLENDAEAYDDSVARATQTVSLTGATITGNFGTGVDIDNEAGSEEDDDGATMEATQTVDIANATISGNRDGVDISQDVYAYGSSTATGTQNVTIDNTTISGHMAYGGFRGDGIYIEQEVGSEDYGSATGTQTLALTNSAITDNGRDGIHAENYAYAEDYGTASATQTLTLSDNEITGNGRNGIYAYNAAEGEDYGSATATQLLTLTGNNISNNGDAGVVIVNYAYVEDGVGRALQTLDLSGGGNTIQNNTYFGVFAYNSYSYDGGGTVEATQTIDLSGGNTISGNGTDIYINGEPTQNVTLP